MQQIILRLSQKTIEIIDVYQILKSIKAARKLRHHKSRKMFNLLNILLSAKIKPGNAANQPSSRMFTADALPRLGSLAIS
jgi:hypothetical protein